MYILGISAFYHDSAAALLKNGEILAAAQEERFSRIKHDASFPEEAIKYCLTEANIQLDDIEQVVFYDKPFLTFERLIETYLSFVPFGLRSFLKSMPLWIKEKLFQKKLILKELSKLNKKPKINWAERLIFSEHHLSHAGSAFYPSPFKKAIVLTMDGVGEWATASVAIGNENHLEIVKEIHFPHSLGLLYSAFTYYCGFKVNSGEYKLMGLAPYGKPKYVELILNHVVDIKTDGSFHLNLSYFDYCTGLRMVNRRFERLFGSPRRKPESKLTQFYMDIAASIQEVTEIIVVKIARGLRKAYPIENLCLAGGVALNCVANSRLLKEKIFENIWIQPAAGDAGGALGAALVGYHLFQNKPRIVESSDKMKGAYLGPRFTQVECEQRLRVMGAKFMVYSNNELYLMLAQALNNEKAIGFFSGRMEFGPRALGARSIIADPRSPKMQKNLNLKVKFRESFRPFAPAVLRENVKDWFADDIDSPYMLLVSDISKKKQKPLTEEEAQLSGLDSLQVMRSDIPAVTHVNNSARLQTVHHKTNPVFHQLIKNFMNLTGCPVLVNTSFNVRGEPIVCTPEDAFRCFMATNLDILVVENCLMLKEQQNQAQCSDYKKLLIMD